MASNIEIANMALNLVGDETINTFSDENKRARAVTLHFEEARRSALRMASWTCCSKRADLPADPAPPVYGFERRYRKPNDFIRLIAIRNAGRGTKYELESEYILTDLSAPISIKYVYDDHDVSRFDPLLTKVMVCVLALDLVEPLSHSQAREQKIQGRLQSWLRMAKSMNGIERPPQEPKPTSWAAARR